MKSVNAYVNFGGNCREAMTFYQQCLGVELALHAYPGPDGLPSPDPAAKIMHSHLAIGGRPILMAADSPQPGALEPGNNVSISIDCETLDEQSRIFAALSAGGTVRMPLTDAPWGARFGMLTDKFGLPWMFNCVL